MKNDLEITGAEASYLNEVPEDYRYTAFMNCRDFLQQGKFNTIFERSKAKASFYEGFLVGLNAIQEAKNVGQSKENSDVVQGESHISAVSAFGNSVSSVEAGEPSTSGSRDNERNIGNQGEAAGDQA